MGKLRLMKASAGSGKTYNLARTYITLMLGDEDPFSYRHILAVTFTNKATEEMKRRIIKELHTLAEDPVSSPYFKDLVPEVLPDAGSVSRKSSLLLRRILHDYGAFSVSTIDSFFQMALKAFARETGHFSSYRVELDKKSLLDESVDRLLDSVSEDSPETLNWLKNNALMQIEEGRKYNLEKGLYKMAAQLYSDEFRAVTEENAIDVQGVYSRPNISKIRTTATAARNAYIKSLRDAALKVEQAFDSAGVALEDTSRSFMARIRKYSSLAPGDVVEDLPEGFPKKAGDYSGWFVKAKTAVMAPLEGVLFPPVADFLSVYSDGYDSYQTSVQILRNISDLGLTAELDKELQDLMKEKNVLSLDESNLILKDIIGGSDTPFIYEKLGVRYEHFLLDEFQDTSFIQWADFNPLLTESNSRDNENLLVGDVKQSIYRWRGGDWKLMDLLVPEQFPDCIREPLKGNHRSLPGIVRFNNAFFRYASRALDGMLFPGGGPDAGRIASIYDASDDDPCDAPDRGQIPFCTGEGEGSVDAFFCEDQDGAILQAINSVLEEGAGYGDIAVLVRKNRDGARIASFLIGEGIPVISDDSLFLKSSVLVEVAAALLGLLNDPSDGLAAFRFRQAGFGDNPEEEVKNLISDISGPLPDVCEELFRRMSVLPGADGLFEDEAAYVMAFLDYVRAFTLNEGDSLPAFLKRWNDDSPCLSSSTDSASVRIMTVHKAKGLEFPYVILPYLESYTLYKQDDHWCCRDMSGTPLEDVGKAAFYVRLSSKSERTFFREDYRSELLMQAIDVLNVLYVAFTRASRGMTVISSPKVSPSTLPAIFLDFLSGDGADGDSWRNSIVRESLDESSYAFHYGTPCGLPAGKSSKEAAGRLDCRFLSWPRVLPASGEEDFFSPEGIAGASPRRNGTVLHSILSSVRKVSDLPAAVGKAFGCGDLDVRGAAEAREFLGGRLQGAVQRGWFPEDGSGVSNEVSIVDTDGSVHRPDRVVIRDGKVVVIDYKFGARRASYRRQVHEYADLYRRMGYEDVAGAIWYLEDDSVEYVD